MPVKNEFTTIRQAITSVQRQTIKDWIMIVLDNNSSDKTVFEVERIQKIDSRIKLYTSGDSLSIAKSWNLAIKLGLDYTNSEFVTMLAGDDFWLEDNYLESSLFRLSNNLELLIPRVILLGEESAEIFEFSNDLFKYKFLYLLRHLTFGDLGNSVYSIFSRNLFDKVTASRLGKPRDGASEDWWFVYSSLLFAKNIEFCSQASYIKRNLNKFKTLKAQTYDDEYYTANSVSFTKVQFKNLGKFGELMRNTFLAYRFIFRRPWRFRVWELPIYSLLYISKCFFILLIAMKNRLK